MESGTWQTNPTPKWPSVHHSKSTTITITITKTTHCFQNQNPATSTWCNLAHWVIWREGLSCLWSGSDEQTFHSRSDLLSLRPLTEMLCVRRYLDCGNIFTTLCEKVNEPTDRLTRSQLNLVKYTILKDQTIHWRPGKIGSEALGLGWYGDMWRF